MATSDEEQDTYPEVTHIDRENGQMKTLFDNMQVLECKVEEQAQSGGQFKVTVTFYHTTNYAVYL